MTKKYRKPEIEIIDPRHSIIRIKGRMLQLTTPLSLHSDLNHGKPSKSALQEGQVDHKSPLSGVGVPYSFKPDPLPQLLPFEGVNRCPKCGNASDVLVGFMVMGGSSLCKQKCVKCGHLWGPGEE
jgi:hypothetical protein